jgi:photosystem II stability/assembly factor-like uncharacterized protein
MIKRIFLMSLIILGGVLFASNACSQYVWNTIYPDFDGARYNCFDKIDCKGNYCTAAGVVVDDQKQTVRWMFWSSANGGISWSKQDPGLPNQSYLPAEYITCLQQIDSLNIIAGTYREIGNSIYSFPLRTFDGGATWKVQSLGNSLCFITDIHFSNPMEGILLAQKYEYDNDSVLYIGSNSRVFVTTNGGATWDSIADQKYYQSNCYSYGNGKFSMYHQNSPILTTSDYWKTIDTVSKLFDSLDAPTNYYRFTYCNFTGGDTIVLYGVYFNFGDQNDTKGVMMQTVDGGKHWHHPIIFDSVLKIEKMTSLLNDTVFAGGPSAGYYLMSTDHGMTWRTDSLILDTNYPAYSLKGIAFTASGNPIASYAFQNKFTGSIPSILIRGERLTRSVESSGRLNYNQRVFPNPATTTLNIASIEAASPFKIYDLFGRVVIKGMVRDRATLTLDISSLSPGIYFVFVDDIHRGIPIPVGKVMVIDH